MKKDSFVKDALILFAITLVSGLLLGAAYAVTKEPIALANKEAMENAYKEVLKANTYDSEDGSEIIEKALSDGKIAEDCGGAELLSLVFAKDESGEVIGYIVTAQANGYGGADKVVVGISKDIKVTGISYPEALPETPGLGQKATEPAFKEQFVGKGRNLIVKEDIDAISGATITSTAVTNSVNAATELIGDYLASGNTDKEAK